jgi:hypothetical protein
MQTLERYLTNVRILLPVSERESITAELRDAVITLQEEQEGELGRALTPQETEHLLQDIGHPVVIAARYRRKQYLIGPELYPVYIMTLKLALAIIAVVAGIFAAIIAMVAGAAAGITVGTVLWIAMIGVLGASCGITMIFAALQSHSPQLDFLRSGGLPAPGKSPIAAWFDQVSGLVISAVLFCWRFGV